MSNSKEVKRKAMQDAQAEGVQVWVCKFEVQKRWGSWTGDDIVAGRAPEPYEVIKDDMNLLMTNGANDLWTALTGGSIPSGYFNNANAAIGVGDSSTAASAGQTDLQASSNKLRVAMDSTYPQISTNTVKFQSTYTSGQANYVWNEWGVFNATSSGRMLNRAVSSLGTKASGATWTFQVTLSLA